MRKATGTPRHPEMCCHDRLMGQEREWCHFCPVGSWCHRGRSAQRSHGLQRMQPLQKPCAKQRQEGGKDTPSFPKLLLGLPLAVPNLKSLQGAWGPQSAGSASQLSAGWKRAGTDLGWGGG